MDADRTKVGNYLSPAAFWEPEFITASAWLEHAPFAFWLVDVLRPSTVVELGTHGGFSHFAFCQAVQTLGLETQCHAVDTWKGDEHSGFYAEELFAQVRDYNELHYGFFSHLVRSTFDDALPLFRNESIDLLHIDGRHFYEDVSHDFESWQPKLSSRAVVLFHDTDIRSRGFGVARFWSEICCDHPHFEFIHGYGLGVLGYGRALPESLETFFFTAGEPGQADKVRAAYARLGGIVSARHSFSVRDSARQYEMQACRRELEAQICAREQENQIHRDQFDRQVAQLAKSEKQLTGLRDKLGRVHAKLDRLRNSKGWRITAPLRAVRGVLQSLSGHKSKSTRLMD